MVEKKKKEKEKKKALSSGYTPAIV